MTSPAEPADPLDTAASALVDGVATDLERALAEATVEGRARVLAHRHVADLVGAEPPPQSDDTARAALAAALAASATHENGDDRLTVVPLASRRRSRWIAPAAAVAAALLLVVGVAGALRSRHDETPGSSRALEQVTATDGQALAGAPAQAPAAGADKAVPPGAPGVAAGAPASTPPPLDGGDVGKITDPAELAQRITDALDGASNNPATVRAGAPRSDVAACTVAAPKVSPVPVTALRYSAVGSYQAARVVVLAYDRSDGPAHILLLLDAKTCDLVTDQDF